MILGRMYEFCMIRADASHAHRNRRRQLELGGGGGGGPLGVDIGVALAGMVLMQGTKRWTECERAIGRDQRGSGCTCVSGSQSDSNINPCRPGASVNAHDATQDQTTRKQRERAPTSNHRARPGSFTLTLPPKVLTDLYPLKATVKKTHIEDSFRSFSKPRSIYPYHDALALPRSTPSRSSARS